jgi:hypothetical protein
MRFARKFNGLDEMEVNRSSLSQHRRNDRGDYRRRFAPAAAFRQMKNRSWKEAFHHPFLD